MSPPFGALGALTTEEIPTNSKPQGRLVAMYPATPVPLRNAIRAASVSAGFTAFLGTMASSNSLFFPNALSAFTIEFMLFVGFVLFTAYAIANTAYEWQRWRRRRHEHYAIHEDGLVVQRTGIEFNYLWWFSLRDYRIQARFTKPVAIILRMEDGSEYRLDNLFDRVDEIVRALTAVLDPLLVRRTVERIRAGEAVTFGDLSLNRQGLRIESTGTKRFIEWGKILSCDIERGQREVLIWTQEPLSVINANNPVGYQPVLSATINTRQFPNLLAFVEIARKVGQLNRIRTSSNDTSAPYQASVTTILQSESLGLFVRGKRNPWKPVRRWLRYAGQALAVTGVGLLAQFWLEVPPFGPAPSGRISGSQEAALWVFVTGLIAVLFCLVISMLRAASAVLNPVRRITEVFQDGMVIHSKEQAQIVLWSDVFQYRIGYANTVYNLFASSTFKHRVDLEIADGRRWRFNDRDSNFGELKELLTGLPHERLLNRALTELHEQGKAIFGPLTVTQDGLVYCARQLAWEHVSLMDQQYQLLIRRKGRLRAFAAVRLDLVPNYYVFLALISHLQSTQS